VTKYITALVLAGCSTIPIAPTSGTGHAWMPTTPAAVWAFLSAHPRPTH